MKKGEALICKKCGRVPNHTITKAKIDPVVKKGHKIECKCGCNYSVGNNYDECLNDWNRWADS